MIQFIRQHSLVEPNQTGFPITWLNEHHISIERIYETLNHEFETTSWSSIYTDTHIQLLPRITSDHHPCLLTLTGTTIQP